MHDKHSFHIGCITKPMLKGVFFIERKGEGGTVLLNTATSVLVGGIISLGITIALLFLDACAISAGIFSEKASLQMVTIACVIGGYFGAKVARKKTKEAGLWIGPVVGIIFCLLILTVRLIFCSSAEGGNGTSLAVIAGGICGSTLSCIGKKKGRKKKRR